MLTADLHRPLDRLLCEAIDGLDEPTLLLDAELRVAHVNRAASPLFSRPTSLREAQRGCLAPVLDGQPCSGEAFCSGCQVFDAAQAALASGGSLGPIHVVRQLPTDGRLETRTFAAHAHPYRLDGKSGLLVTLDEITEDATQRLAG